MSADAVASTTPEHEDDPGSRVWSSALRDDPVWSWLAFGLVHAVLAICCLPAVSDAYGDVLSVYPYWVGLAEDGSWLGIDAPWVYPLLAWAPILAANVFGPDWLPLVWMLVVTALDAIAFAMLRRAPNGWVLAWAWLAFQLVAGPIALARIDGPTVAVCVIALALLRKGRSRWGAAALTAAAWMKIWPGVLWLAVLVARKDRLGTLAAGAIVSGAVLALALVLGSEHVLSFLGAQSGRGLQIEAVAATPWMWAAVHGDATVEFDRVIYTFQVYGTGVETVAALATPVLVAVVLVVLALGVLALRRAGAERRADTVAWLSLALVAALIVTNKVGSPQFVLWLTIPLLLLIEARVRRGEERGRWHSLAAGLIVAVAAVTQLQFPWTYDALVLADPAAVGLLTLRSALHVALLVIAIVMLVRTARGSGAASSVEQLGEEGADAVGLDEEAVVPESALEHDRLGSRDRRREP